MAQKRSEPLFYTELQQVTWCALGQGLARWQARAVAGESDPLDEPTLILLGHDTRTRALIDPSLPLLALPPCRIMEVGSVDAQLDWAEAGFGVAIVPDFSLHPRLNLTAPVTSLSDFPVPVWATWCVRIRCYQEPSSSCCTGWRRRSRSPTPI